MGCSVLHERKGQYHRALQDYDQTIRLEPWNAIQDFDQTIELDPSFAPAFNDLGNAHERKGQYDRAIRDFDQTSSSLGSPQGSSSRSTLAAVRSFGNSRPAAVSTAVRSPIA
jgi:hypothetical protein